MRARICVSTLSRVRERVYRDTPAGSGSIFLHHFSNPSEPSRLMNSNTCYRVRVTQALDTSEWGVMRYIGRVLRLASSSLPCTGVPEGRFASFPLAKWWFRNRRALFMYLRRCISRTKSDFKDRCLPGRKVVPAWYQKDGECIKAPRP